MFYAVLIIIILVVAWVLYGALQPAGFAVSRHAHFAAPPRVVYDQISNFHNWAAWSPWEKMDPTMERNFSGATSGVGAKYAWTGNKKVGEGNMEITTAEPSKRVLLELNFLKPFEAHNITEFTFTPDGAGTLLNWEMRGTRPLIMRMMGFLFNMDKIVGGDFERGLANLKAVVEK